jgi:calcineurin-like phosphoesterase family protein
MSSFTPPSGGDKYSPIDGCGGGVFIVLWVLPRICHRCSDRHGGRAVSDHNHKEIVARDVKTSEMGNMDMKLVQRLFIFPLLAIFVSGVGIPFLIPGTTLAQTADPVFVGAGDISNCSNTQDESTAQLLDNIPGTVFTLGDSVYPNGTLTQFNDCYEPTWGRHKNRIRPSPGNHDYNTAGAAGYYTYFGAAASPLDTNCTSNCKGYYSYNLGAWHIIALNSEIDHVAGSAQEQWLRADLAANQSMCTLAYWHKPRFSSGQHGSITGVQPFWQALYDYEADVVLSGHDHVYERFAPQNPNGQADSSRGIREFVVGTGGAGLYPFPTIQPNSQVRNNTTFGVLKLTLHSTSYDWEFIPIVGQTFTDSGSSNCVGAGQSSTETPTPGDTPTATDTLIPGDTPKPSDTPAPTDTPTPGNTPTATSTSPNTPNPTPTNTATSAPMITPAATSTFTSIPVNNSLYLSLTGNQTIGSIASADEDILRFDGQTWSMLFDGSDVGVGSSDLFGFSLINANTLLMSFSSSVSVNGLAVSPQDIVRFDAASLGSVTAGTFSMYFDGSDVGLDASSEYIDSVSVLPDGRVLISTTGNISVPGVTGTDEDVLAFTPTSLGNVTSGTWAMYFDGSDVGLADSNNEDIDALDVANGNIYLSTLGDFAVTGVSGADEDVFVCAPTSLGSITACNYLPALYFDGSMWGLSSNDVDAIHLIVTGSPPTNTPTATQTPSGPTDTPTPRPSPTPTSTPTHTLTLTPTFTPPATNTPGSSDLIFTDGFQSGDLSAWTSSTTDLGDLNVSTAAALVGSQGMQAVIDDPNSIYVTDDSPIAQPRYRARFYFDPNSLPMASGDAHFIFKGFAGTSTEVLRMEFRYFSGAYQSRAFLLDDGTIWTGTNWFTLSDAPNIIELDWRASTAVGANNGGLTLWINGTQQQDLTGIDNDTRRIDRSRLGALTGIDAGTRGTYYFDAFESRRQTYIGP